MALNFAFTADNRNFMNALHEITSGVQDATRQIEKEGVQIEEFFNRIKNISAISFAGFGLGEMVSKISSTRAYFQDIESSMKVFLGNAEKAAAFTEELQTAAYYNMYEFADLADASKQLIAYGNDVENVTDIIYKLSEVGVATGQQLGDMVNLYNRAKSTGVVGSQDIASWAAKGLILKDVMKEMGTYVEGQTITFKQLNEVLDKVTSEGGMFHGIQDAMMDNINSNLGQLEDQVGLLFNEIGGYLQEPINWALKRTSELMDNWKEIGFTIAAVLASAGTQKGIELVSSSIDRAATQSAYAAEMAELQALLPLKQDEEKTTLEQAVASGHLTEAKAAEIMALRQEVEGYSKLLEEKEAEASKLAESAQSFADEMKTVGEELIGFNNEEIESLQDKIAANKEWLESLDENIQWMFEEQVATENATLAEQINTLATENNSIQTEINSAAEASNTAARNLATVSAERETVAVGLETSATNINSAATTNNTIAANIHTLAIKTLTAAHTALTAAYAKLNAVIMANPYAVAIAAAALLGYSIYRVASYQTNLEKCTESANKAVDSQTRSMQEELSKLDELKKRLETAKKGTDEWKNAKESIVSQFGNYLSGLDAEIEKTGNLKTSYDQLTKSIRLSAAARAMEKYEADNDISEEFDENLAEIQKRLGGKFNKIGEDGKVVRNTVGLPQRTNLDKKSQDAILNLAYRYMNGEDVKFTAQAEGYLRQIGFFDEVRRSDSYRVKKTGLADGIRTKNSDLQKGRELIANRYQVSLEDIENVGKPEKVYDDTRTEKQQLKAKLDGLIKQYDNLRKSNKEDSKEAEELRKEIKATEAELKDFHDYKSENKKTSKKSTGPTTEQLASKEENAAGKIADLMRKQAQERLRIEQDYEYERWQTRIDLMDEGEKKILAQQQLNNDKELTELKRRQESEEEAELQRQMSLFNAEQDRLAASNKKYAKKIFRDSDIDESEFDKIKERYKALEEDLLSSQKKAEQDRLDAAKESMNAYLKEFGSYQQKRKAIIEEYDQKIAEASNSGERKIAVANKDKALADLDFDEWQENGGMSLAFGDISRLSKETVSQLISDMEKYRSKIIATFDPEKIQRFEEALANLRSADIDFGFDFSEGNEILASLRERLAIQQQIADALANETALLEQKRQIEEELAALNSRIFAVGINTAAIGPDGNKVDDATVISDDMVIQADALRVKLDAVSRSLEKSTRNSQQLQSQLKALGKVKFADIQKFSNNLLKAGKNASDLASIFSDDVADAVQDGADKVGVMLDAFSELSSNIEMLAKAGKDAVKETVDASKTIVDGASAGMKASASATSASLSAMEKASAILAIIGAAIQLATMIASLVNPDKKHEKNIERLQEQIDTLEKSYDSLGRAIDRAYSSDASALIGQQETLLLQQEALIRQQKMEEEAKKKSDKDKIKQYEEQLDEINRTLEDNREKAKEAIIGEDLKGAINEFASLYAEAWNDGTDAAQKSMAAVKNIVSSALSELLKKNIQPTATRFYDALAEAMADGVLTDDELANLDSIKREMDGIAAQSQEQWDKIQARYKDLEELKEELTDISFDSVRDNFKSLLSDMESTTEDFTDSFSDMLKNALIEGLMSEKYDLMLKEWYDEFAEAMNDHTLTDEEREGLKQKYDSIVQQGIEDRDFINSIVGGGAYSQEASQGGWAAMGQDTADELNGRFTALTELNAINNTLTAEGNLLSSQILETLRSFTALSMVTDSDDSTLRDIRDMMFLSTGHLEDIAKHSKQLAFIREGIENMKDLIDKRL